MDRPSPSRPSRASCVSGSLRASTSSSPRKSGSVETYGMLGAVSVIAESGRVSIELAKSVDVRATSGRRRDRSGRRRLPCPRRVGAGRDRRLLRRRRRHRLRPDRPQGRARRRATPTASAAGSRSRCSRPPTSRPRPCRAGSRSRCRRHACASGRQRRRRPVERGRDGAIAQRPRST